MSLLLKLQEGCKVCISPLKHNRLLKKEEKEKMWRSNFLSW